MSTTMYLHCDTHDPYIRSEEVGHNQSYLPAIRNDLRERDSIVENMRRMVETNDLYPEFSDSYLAARWWFLFKHPHCDISVWDEYGREYSMLEGPDEAPIGMETTLGHIEAITEERDGMTVKFHRLTPAGQRVLRLMSQANLTPISLRSNDEDEQH